MGLRDIVILAIVLAGSVAALRRPWIGVLLWTWLSIMNPHRFSWGIAYTAPVGAMAAASTLLGLLFTRERRHPFQGTPVTWFVLFCLMVTLSWLMGVDPKGDYPQWDKVMKIYLMTFVALALIITRWQIEAFVWVTVASLALLGVKGGLFTILTGGNYRVWGPPGSFIYDNNEFALSVIMTIPLVHYLQLQLAPGWRRQLMNVAMLLCAAAAVGTHSRGGFLAIIAMGTVFWWRSRSKLAIGGMILFVALVALPLMPAHWWDRMSTISEYEQDGSAMGRINAWRVAWGVATHHLFGGGMSYQYPHFFEAYGVHETIVRAAHSIYFQVLGNHGFPGLACFLGLWCSTYFLAGRLRVEGRKVPEAHWVSDLGGMVQVSLVGYAVGGAFLSLSYFDLPYNMMVMVVAATVWLKQRAWEREPALPERWLAWTGWLRRQEVRRA
jgi:putative inorganic carbon (HCO3(-)) transporter